LERCCPLRHPRTCKYYENGCRRSGWCDYLQVSHLKRDKAGNDTEQEDSEKNMEVDCLDDVIDKETKECSNCKCNDANNECDKCGKHFCSKCEYKVSGKESESVINFF
jgi:hypothetical protein